MHGNVEVAIVFEFSQKLARNYCVGFTRWNL